MARDLASPKSWESAKPGMSRHHVIPFSTLRECWQLLYTQLTTTDWPEARKATFQYLTLCDRQLADIDQWLERLRVDQKHRLIAGHRTAQALEVHEMTLIETVAMWPAWNIVEGPARKPESDPGNELEIFTYGLSSREEERMQAIRSLYHAIRQFLNSGLGRGSLNEFAINAHIARNTLQFEHLIPYRPDMWEKDENGDWRRRTH